MTDFGVAKIGKEAIKRVLTLEGENMEKEWDRKVKDVWDEHSLDKHAPEKIPVEEDDESPSQKVINKVKKDEIEEKAADLEDELDKSVSKKKNKGVDKIAKAAEDIADSAKAVEKKKSGAVEADGEDDDVSDAANSAAVAVKNVGKKLAGKSAAESKRLLDVAKTAAKAAATEVYK